MRPSRPGRSQGSSARRARPPAWAGTQAGVVTFDSETQLTGVPAAASTYRLGARSGLEWSLDQHKEKTPKDPAIRE
jgi:predicted helicase